MDNQNIILNIKSEHSYEFKIIFDILQENSANVNLSFIKNKKY